jgi:hypothetical protein
VRLRTRLCVLMVTHAAVQPLQDKLRSANHQITSREGDAGDEDDSDEDDDDDDYDYEDDDECGSYYSTDALAGLSSRTISSEPSSSGSWGVIQGSHSTHTLARMQRMITHIAGAP